MTIILWLLLWLPLCHAQPDNLSVEYDQQLKRGVRFYQKKDYSSAMEVFLSLRYAQSAPAEYRQEARLYIGEILYIQGDRQGAQDLFRELFEEDPKYKCDRFIHPLDVCDYFDFYKKTFLTPPPQPPPLKTKAQAPWYTYAPFGLYHLREGPKWRGYLYLSGQLLTGIVSTTLFTSLTIDHSYMANDLDKRDQLQSYLLWQRATTVGFYGLWALSVADARIMWRRGQNQTVQTSMLFPLFRFQGKF